MTTAEAHAGLDDAVEAANGAGDAIVDETHSAAGQLRDAIGGAVEHVPAVIDSARAGAERVAGRLPDAAERAKGGVLKSTATLQTLPDSTLRLLAATSIGLAAGLQLAGAPRIVALVAIAPALAVGAAMISRPR